MKTEKEVKKQLDGLLDSNDVGYDYRKTYASALSWVLEIE